MKQPCTLLAVAVILLLSAATTAHAQLGIGDQNQAIQAIAASNRAALARAELIDDAQAETSSLSAVVLKRRADEKAYIGLEISAAIQTADRLTSAVSGSFRSTETARIRIEAGRYARLAAEARQLHAQLEPDSPRWEHVHALLRSKMSALRASGRRMQELQDTVERRIREVETRSNRRVFQHTIHTQP